MCASKYELYSPLLRRLTKGGARKREEELCTREHHLHQVPFLDLFCRGQTLQDVVRAQVMAEQQDLLIHPKKPTFRELRRKRRQ